MKKEIQYSELISAFYKRLDNEQVFGYNAVSQFETILT